LITLSVRTKTVNILESADVLEDNSKFVIRSGQLFIIDNLVKRYKGSQIITLTYIGKAEDEELLYEVSLND
jgi:hypothetical protein